MSMKQAKAFIEKMKTDEAFHDRIMAIEDADKRLKAIPLEGFECTTNDINLLYTACELAIEEYEHAITRAGGVCTNNCYDVRSNCCPSYVGSYTLKCT